MWSSKSPPRVVTTKAPGEVIEFRAIVCLFPNSRNLEPVSAIANQVSAEKLWIWKIRERRLGAEIGGLELDERDFAVAETHAHSHKSRKSRALS